MDIKTALQQASKLLKRAGLAEANLTAEVLLAHILRCDRSYLYTHPERQLSWTEYVQFARAIHERLEGKPLHYITGHREFYGRDFLVSPASLIPRPETEHLIEIALQKAAHARTVVDIGTGSGVLAITLALELPSRPQTIATDISLPALKLAQKNAQRLHAPVCFVQCDMASALATACIDLVVCNPPYVAEKDQKQLPKEVREYEPPIALFPGPTGLEFYQRLIPEAQRVLRAEGWLIVELGFGQADSVRSLFPSPPWTEPEIFPDLAGIPRVLAAQLKRNRQST